MSPKLVRELKVACRKFPDYPTGKQWRIQLPNGDWCAAYKSVAVQAQESLSGSNVIIGAHQFSPKDIRQKGLTSDSE